VNPRPFPTSVQLFNQLELPLHVYKLFEHAVRYGNDSCIRLIAALHNDHVGNLGRKIRA